MDLQSLNDQHDELFKMKLELERKLKEIKWQIDNIVKEKQKICIHETVNHYSDYDGHRWQSDYFCALCSKELSFVTKEQTIVNKF